MKDFWTKNKYTVMSMVVYLTLTISFGNLSGYRLPAFIISTLSLPLIYNQNIDSKSIWWTMLGACAFGFFISPFDISSMSPNIYNKISYFAILLSLNVFYNFHRHDHQRRKERFDKSDKREVVIEELLNPVKKRFFQ